STATAYLPLLDALQQVVHASDDAIAVLRSRAPTWLLQLPGVLSPDDHEDPIVVLPSEPDAQCRCDRYPPTVAGGTSQGPSGVFPSLRSQTWMTPSAERKSGSRSASAKPIFRKSATRSGRSPTCARPSPLKSKTFCPVTCRSNLPKPGISNGYVTLFPVRRCV